MKSLHHTVSAAAGEWSPKLDARVDQQKYASALRQCLNMIPYKSGGLTRRNGTQKIAAAKLANTMGNNYCVRNMAFIFSPETTFLLEWGNNYVRFYSNGQKVVVSSASTWTTATNYPAGSFTTDPTNALIYYSAAGLNGGTVQPHLDSTHWVQQTIYEVPTPYNANAGSGSIFQTDVFQIVPCQINDVVYIVHPDFPPYSLTRFGDTDWVMKEVNFISPALLDQNVTDTIITPSALIGNGITLVASAPAWVGGNYYTLANSVEVSGVIYNCIVPNVSDIGSFSVDLAKGYWQQVSIFNSGHVGSTWQLGTLRSSTYAEYDGTAASGFTAGISSEIQCLGSYEVHTYGVWSADIDVQRSLDGGITWSTVQTITGRSDRNADLSGTAAIVGVYRLVISNVSVPVNAGATNPRVVFECDDALLYGLAKITAVSDAYNATVDVVTKLTDSNPMASEWQSDGNYLFEDSVTDIVAGQTYIIVSLGSTDFTLIGASSNTVGVIFNATDVGIGTGTVTSLASYGFINYIRLFDSFPTDTPPPQDLFRWEPYQPGGTEYWSEAAWSNYRGFPQAIASFQQRVIYASSGFEPQRIWGTVQNDIENFALGDQTQATDSFAFDLNAPGRGPIVWLISQMDLFAGFSGAEWVINSGSTNSSGGSSGAAITPSNINAFEQGSFGSSPDVQPAIIGNAVFFAQRQADAIRQMLFSVYTQKYMSNDLSTLADHLFSAGIVQLAYQSRWRHQGIIWVVTQQGTLCGLTYDLDQEVFGWCKAQTGYGQTTPEGVAITPDNGFESVAVIDGQGTDDDEVWVVANRLIGGVQTRFIERINPVNWEEIFVGAPTPPSPVLAEAFYVDCGITVTNPGSLVITGLSYLNGRYVVGLADGNAFGPLLVAGGQVTLPSSIPTTVGLVQIGLPIRYAGQPMRIDSDPRLGNTQGLIKQLSDVFVRVWNSCGGSISNGSSTSPVVPLPYTPSVGSPFAVPVLVTVPTDLRITPMLNAAMDADPIIIITGNDALPITVLGIFLKYAEISTP